MSNGTDQRIRHVAIVLQSLDAATSRGLLSQLPSTLAKQVRQSLVNLGAVSHQERSQAFQSMKDLFGENFAGSSEQHESPAAALLATQHHPLEDQVEWSEAAQATTAHPTSALPLENIVQPSDQHASPINSKWQHIPIETFADILQSERPIVIATVINQLSIERATSIVQLLPIQVAGATLAAVPHLHMTDAAILRDIEQEVDRKIGHHQPQMQASTEGLSRLQAILSGLPESQRNIWFQAVSQSNPVLGAKLGWHTHLESDSNTHSQLGSSANVVSQPTQAVRQGDGLPKPKYEDVFEEPVLLPISSKVTIDRSVSPHESERVANKQKDAPKSSQDEPRLNESNSLDSILTLSDKDFVSVLHACPAQSVLLALSGASKLLITRVERLVPPKDVQRLRLRLRNSGPIQLRDVDEAQRLVVETAQKLFAIGSIGALQNATFTAAA
jgi:flagellar motor switch protein FliG